MSLVALVSQGDQRAHGTIQPTNNHQRAGYRPDSACANIGPAYSSSAGHERSFCVVKSRGVDVWSHIASAGGGLVAAIACENETKF
jgi:hypothetical protein